MQPVGWRVHQLIEYAGHPIIFGQWRVRWVTPSMKAACLREHQWRDHKLVSPPRDEDPRYHEAFRHLAEAERDQPYICGCGIYLSPSLADVRTYLADQPQPLIIRGERLYSHQVLFLGVGSGVCLQMERGWRCQHVELLVGIAEREEDAEVVRRFGCVAHVASWRSVNLALRNAAPLRAAHLVDLQRIEDKSYWDEVFSP